MTKGELTFPLRHEPREAQLKAMDFARRAVNGGRRFLLLDLPTGAGKSQFALMFANWYTTHVSPNAKFHLLTNSKILQDQYRREFPYIRVLKGRTNYDCEPHNTDCRTGKEYCRNHGPHCTDCPYDLAKAGFLGGPVSATNFHMFYTMALYTKSIPEERKNVLIVDEAHDFESVLCDFVSVRLGPVQARRFGYDAVESTSLGREVSKIGSPSGLAEYLSSKLVPRLTSRKDRLLDSIGDMKGKSFRARAGEHLAQIDAALLTYEAFLDDFGKNPENWILDRTGDRGEETVSVEPRWGTPYLRDRIWPGYDHVVLMSATLLDKGMCCRSNGIEEAKASYLRLPSPFPPEHRPVVYAPVGKMSYAAKGETLPKMVEALRRILVRHPNEKGIVHCVSYEVAKAVQGAMGSDGRLLFPMAGERDAALAEHLTSGRPTVLVSPSLVTGIDLPGDSGRFQVILKVPYPNLGSARIKARHGDDPAWYQTKTCQDVIQMCGRSIRSGDDWAKTYILDACFGDLLRHSGDTLPPWFVEAIRRERPDRL